MSDPSVRLTTALRDQRGRVWGYKSRAQLAKGTRPTGAIVFVHGFKIWGDAVDTWNDFPTALLSEPKATRYDVFYFGHDSRYSAATGATDFRKFLTALAERPATDIMNPSLASGQSERPLSASYDRIIVCAHSLGAVIVRLALLEAVDKEGHPLAWCNRVKLLLFAPAHMGASILGLAVSGFAGLPFAAPASALISWRYAALQDLHEKCSTLSDLRGDTRRLLRTDANLYDHLRANVVHGKKDKIVRKNRFVLDHPAEQFDWADHITVCKPLQQRREPLEVLLEQLA